MLLLLEQNVRIVIEVDENHHYSDRGAASPRKYAQMVEKDRRLRLFGYELYRFGGAEFADTEVPEDGKIKVGRKARRSRWSSLSGCGSDMVLHRRDLSPASMTARPGVLCVSSIKPELPSLEPADL